MLYFVSISLGYVFYKSADQNQTSLTLLSMGKSNQKATKTFAIQNQSQNVYSFYKVNQTYTVAVAYFFVSRRM